jgi:pyridinium-3,5-biscarboxylic acid mononucleotide synthase
MYGNNIKEVMEKVKNGKLSVEQAVEKLKFLPYEDIGHTKIDHHRSIRKGFPEVIYCENKTDSQIIEIMKKLNSRNSSVLGTRASRKTYNKVKKSIPKAEYNEKSRTIIISSKKKSKNDKLPDKKILIVSAGTSDIPVAEEAAVTAESMENNVERLYDVGVAGLHRLLSNKEKLASANVLIIVAGMDGALPSVVSGMFEKPIIAVPTSVGYGAAFNGIAPLLTMLNSCSPGVTVVNIDNGFGAGYFASLINK